MSRLAGAADEPFEVALADGALADGAEAACQADDQQNEYIRIWCGRGGRKQVRKGTWEPAGRRAYILDTAFFPMCMCVHPRVR